MRLPSLPLPVPLLLLLTVAACGGHADGAEARGTESPNDSSHENEGGSPSSGVEPGNSSPSVSFAYFAPSVCSRNCPEAFPVAVGARVALLATGLPHYE